MKATALLSASLFLLACGDVSSSDPPDAASFPDAGANPAADAGGTEPDAADPPMTDAAVPPTPDASVPPPDGPTNETDPPTASVRFPPPQSVIETDTITISGTASDASQITSVVVDGVPAMSTDGYATWRATVPLVPGHNTVAIATTDQYGNTNASAASVVVRRSDAMMSSPFAIERDPVSGDLYVADYFRREVVRVDATSGEREVVTAICNAQSMSWDAAGARLLVVEACSDKIRFIDPSDGSDTLISSNSVGTGPALTYPRGAAVNGNTVLVVDSDLDALVAIDTTTLVRTVISSPSVGTGPNLVSPISVRLANATTVYVSDISADALFRIDLSTGNRVVVSSNSGVGGGAWMTSPLDFVLDPANNRALVTDGNSAAVIAVDLTSGFRTVISGDGGGSGVEFRHPRGIELNASGSTAYVCDSGLDAVFSINLATGARVLLSESFAGTGPQALSLRDLLWDSTSGDSVLALDTRVLFRVDAMTGERTKVSTWSSGVPNIGSGPTFNTPVAMAMDAANNRVIVIDRGSEEIYAISLANGDRSVISPDTNGDIGFVSQAVVNPTTNTLLYLDRDNDSLMAVSLANGVRTVVSGGATGTGPALTNQYGVVLDSANNRVIVVDDSRILGIDLTSGARTEISGDGEPGPPLLGSTRMAKIGATVYVRNYQNKYLAVDLATGNRTEVSGSKFSEGELGGLVPTPDGLLINVDIQRLSVNVVDPLYGDRIVLSK